MTALGQQRLDIGLQAGTTAGVMAGKTENNGTKRSRRIHALSLPSKVRYRYVGGSPPQWAGPPLMTADYNNNSRGKLLMKTVEQWFDEYGESHRNPLNKLVHWVCVPLITFSVLGMLWALHPLVAAVVLGLALAFYVVLSWQLALVMALQGLVMLWILHLMPVVFWPCVAIFVVAWIGQFIGHHVEGKKPSFFKDVQFLLIGPAWLMGFVFRRLGWRY